MELKTEPLGLLVSVRSLEEAALVADLGVSVLDLKEPNDGALAPVKPALWKRIAELYGHQIALSAAMGELDDAIKLADAVPESFTFAKAGPSNRLHIDQLVADWRVCRSKLHSDVALVAVAYADYQQADSLPPIEVFEVAAKQGLRTWLVDTYVKDGRSTLEHLTTNELLAIGELARRTTSQWVLAGSIRWEMLDGLASNSIMPDMIGVRGSVCDHSRADNLCENKVKHWVAKTRCANANGQR